MGEKLLLLLLLFPAALATAACQEGWTNVDDTKDCSCSTDQNHPEARFIIITTTRSILIIIILIIIDIITILIINLIFNTDDPPMRWSSSLLSSSPSAKIRRQMKPATGEELANVPSVTATPTLKVIIEETRQLDHLLKL